MGFRYKKIKLVDSSDNLKTYLSKDIETQQQVLIEKIKIQNLEHNEALLKEIISLYSIRSYPYFCKILDYKIEGPGSDLNRAFIITEYYPKGTLHDHLKEAKKNNLFYTNRDIDKSILDLLNGFAILQKLGISHRAVEPKNISISNDGSLKISNFRYSSTCLFDDLAIIEIPSYTSPEMRNRLISFNKSRKDPEEINYTLSDVWSLGVVFLSMITLNSQEEFEDLNLLQETINTKISQIENPVYQELISKMLVIDPVQRKDFSFLLAWFEATQKNTEDKHPKLTITRCDSANFLISQKKSANFTCEKCDLSSEFLTCDSCGAVSHTTCLEDEFYKCSTCKAGLNYKEKLLKCKKCDLKFKGKQVSLKCLHRLCFKCRADEETCMDCLGFSEHEKIKGDLARISEFRVRGLNEGIIIDGKDLAFMTGDVCLVCQRASHKGPCYLFNSDEEIVNCVFCKNDIKRDKYCFFVNCCFCKKSYCSVCLRSALESSHLNCSRAYCFDDLFAKIKFLC